MSELRLAVDNDRHPGQYSKMSIGPDTSGGGGGDMTDLERRVGNLERDVHALREDVTTLKVDVAAIKATMPILASKADIQRIDAIVPTLATKADLNELKASFGDLRADMMRWTIATMIAGMGIVATIVFGMMRTFPINLPPVHVSVASPQAPEASAPQTAAPANQENKGP